MAVLPSGLPEVVDYDEDLARFLFSSSHFSSNGVKPAAFLPNKDGETSVFRHGSEPRAQLWQIAADHVAREGTLHGAAVVKARYVRAARLDVAPKEPPPRHANIVGWASSADAELGKAERRLQALEIAGQAELVRR